MTKPSPPIEDRQSALEFLFGRINYERSRAVPYRSRRFKLDRMRKLAEMLGHPERRFPAVHIAGTKGKGSTACMVAAALHASGIRTGLYTSPHLHRLEERFVVDGVMCREEELVKLLADIQEVVIELDQEAQREGQGQGPTYFEITTAAALLHFQRQQVDCAVLEVGLGGRLDSTNICHPVVSVITTISLDHTRQLGKTLAQIAGEKAGIIKPGVPVVTGVRQRSALQVVHAMASESDSPLLAIGRDFDFEHLPQPGREPAEPLSGATFHYWENVDGRKRWLRHVQLGMLGRHQAANGAVALATLACLQRQGWQVSEPAIRDALAQARCPARFEIVGRAPTVVLDAAHNPASVAALHHALVEHFPTRPRVLIFAASVDKDVPRMLGQLLPHFEYVALTRYQNNPRAMDPHVMASWATKATSTNSPASVRVEVFPEPQRAWQAVRSWVTPDHVICVAGSFFLAAELREHVEAMAQEAGPTMP